jgi:carboxyl-terminal processing protease
MRVDSRIDYALSLLDQAVRLRPRETYRFDREDAEWAKSDAELDAIWRSASSTTT